MLRAWDRELAAEAGLRPSTEPSWAKLPLLCVLALKRDARPRRPDVSVPPGAADEANGRSLAPVPGSTAPVAPTRASSALLELRFATSPPDADNACIFRPLRRQANWIAVLSRTAFATDPNLELSILVNSQTMNIKLQPCTFVIRLHCQSKAFLTAIMASYSWSHRKGHA